MPICVLSLETGRQYSLHMRPGTFSFSTDYEEEQEGLYNLAVEYDKTPVEKREKEKRYRIRWDLSGVDKERAYLNKDGKGNVFFFDDSETAGFKTIFTAREVELLPLWVSHFIVEEFLIQEEVEDDEVVVLLFSSSPQAVSPSKLTLNNKLAMILFFIQYYPPMHL